MISACRLARRPSPYSCLRRAFYATTSARVLKEGWNAVIGIEVHAQINSKTKLFSGTFGPGRSKKALTYLLMVIPVE